MKLLPIIAVIALTGAFSASLNAFSLHDLSPKHIWHEVKHAFHTATHTVEQATGSVEGIAFGSLNELEGQVMPIIQKKSSSTSQSISNEYSARKNQLQQEYEQNKITLEQKQKQTAASFRSTFESQLAQGLKSMKSQLQASGGSALDLYQDMASELILNLLQNMQTDIQQYYCWTGCDSNTSPYKGPIEPYLQQFNLSAEQLKQAQNKIEETQKNPTPSSGIDDVETKLKEGMLL